jgi:hypothetical protein
MKRRLAALFLYAAAMAFVEAAVVVYIRLLYPAGSFRGTIPFSQLVYRTEVLREAATIVMLLAVAYVAFDRLRLRVLTFFWIFAVWDLSYYVFLKLILGWPPSLTTPDVLFLIPIPWIAPVWVPLAVWSTGFVAAGYMLAKSAPAEDDRASPPPTA